MEKEIDQVDKRIIDNMTYNGPPIPTTIIKPGQIINNNMIVKTKKKFSERWTNQFVKKFEGIKTVLSGTFVQHDKLDDAMMETYDYLFTLAKSAKVTPAQFAKVLANKDGLYEYSSKVVTAIVTLKDKAEAKLAKEAAKASARVEKVAKKVSKKATK